MRHFVYIIYSSIADVYYKGYSLEPEERLVHHNDDNSRYTSGKGSWKLVYSKGYETKREALIEERTLKKLNRKSLELLINKD